MKRTPLHSTHARHGARLIEFVGWEMPVQYTSIGDEHLTVRSAAGIFDISHMGEFLVNGPAAEEFLNQTLTNDIRKLTVGTGQYTLLCNERGGTVDDLYAYRIGSQEYLLIVNASRAEVDFQWLVSRSQQYPRNADLTLKDVSEVTGAVAVQGPQVASFINDCFPGPSIEGTSAGQVTELKKNQIAKFKFEEGTVWVSRTGYSGEDGFEIVGPSENIVAVWRCVLEAGRPAGLKPAGLGARDTLRTEMCYPLYGHELTEDISPIQAGLGFFVSFEKGPFVGREPMLGEKGRGPARKLAAFKLTDKGAPPRAGYAVYGPAEAEGVVGHVVSGTQSPSLNTGIGMAYVPPPLASPGTTLFVEARGHKFSATVVPKPIYRKPQ